MNSAGSAGGLSIFARSFLLVFAALAVSFGLAVALFVLRPPLRDPPVSVYDVAEVLRLPGEARQDTRPPPFERGPQRDGGGPPRDGAGPPRDAGGPPPDRERRREHLQVEDRSAAPGTWRGGDAALAASLARQLARELGIADADVVVQLPAQTARERQRSGSWFPEAGFVAARRLDGSTWRTVSSGGRGFSGPFRRQALALFALGLVLLLPLAWLFARALAAPIRRFAEGARRLGQDPASPPLPSSGPPEMRHAVDSFNSMQGRLNRLLQERTQMVGAIAHDLRTPLTRLAFRLEELPAPLRGKVETDIGEMKSMIAAALDFLRDRSLTGHREPLDLRLLVERVVDDHADTGHDVTFSAGAAVTLLGAPLALRRLVNNLVENALKYGSRAHLQLQVAGTQAVLDVDDDGPGVPDSHLERVFEPFFRLEGSRNRDTGGIGLGLATARAIATDHGGEIVLANRKGGGLRATVRLPLPD